MTITQQQIIALAVEAGFHLSKNDAEVNGFDTQLFEFFALAYQRGVRDERESCIVSFEEEADSWVAWPQAGAAKRKGVAAIRARSDTQQQLSGWHRAVDEEMVLTHLGVADPSDSYETAKKKLNDLIAWHVSAATDPAVNGGYVLARQDSATIPPSSTTE